MCLLNSSAPTGLLQILNADLVHGEEGCRGSVLWTHVGDGGSVSDGQLRDTRAKKLHKLSNDTHLTEMLKAQGGGKYQIVKIIKHVFINGLQLP